MAHRRTYGRCLVLSWRKIDFQYSNIDWAQRQVEEYFKYMSEQKRCPLGVIGGGIGLTQGYSRPFAPNRSASVVEVLPWRFAGDLLLIHFSADPAALSALLPAFGTC